MASPLAMSGANARQFWVNATTISDTSKMSLREFTPRICYRSNAGNVVDDFYVPCMQRSILYRRAR